MYNSKVSLLEICNTYGFPISVSSWEEARGALKADEALVAAGRLKHRQDFEIAVVVRNDHEFTGTLHKFVKPNFWAVPKSKLPGN